MRACVATAHAVLEELASLLLAGKSASGAGQGSAARHAWVYPGCCEGPRPQALHGRSEQHVFWARCAVGLLACAVHQYTPREPLACPARDPPLPGACSAVGRQPVGRQPVGCQPVGCIKLAVQAPAGSCAAQRPASAASAAVHTRPPERRWHALPRLQQLHQCAPSCGGGSGGTASSRDLSQDRQLLLAHVTGEIRAVVSHGQLRFSDAHR